MDPNLQKPKTEKRYICFNDAKGNRDCEEVPERDEVNCNKDGLCSVYLSKIEDSKSVGDVTKNYGVHVFRTTKDGVVTKTLTGVVKKEDLSRLEKDLKLDLKPQTVHSLRLTATGDISPPKICNLNPLSGKCQPYLASKDWYWLGPLKGWVKSDGLRNAIKSLKSNDAKVMKRNDAKTQTNEPKQKPLESIAIT